MRRNGAAPDVAVVGGGIVGCAVAYYLAQEGARVAVFDRDRIGAQASSAAAGMLAPLAEDAGPGPFLDLALASLQRYAALAADLRASTGIDIELLIPGLLRVALDDAEAAEYKAALAWQRDLGLPVRWLDVAALRTLVPAIAPAARGAVYSEAEHQVNPTRVTEAFARAAVVHGAVLHEGAPVRGLLRQGSRVVGLHLGDGDLHASHVVLAAGAWAAACGEWLGVRLPVEPIKGQMVAVAPHSARARQTGVVESASLRHTLYGHDGYLVPKADGTIYAGATVERVGFDRRVTAGGVARLLALLPALVPGLGDPTFVRAWAGLRPGTPDHLPILGPVPGLDGVTLATGHYRNGILLAPITGELIAQAALGQPTTLPLAPFGVERFATVAVGAS